MSPTVHVLAHGRVLCGNVHGLPKDWGPEHRGVSAFEEGWRDDATCALCRKVTELLLQARRMNFGERHEVMLPPAGPAEEESE
mgnify:FL=1